MSFEQFSDLKKKYFFFFIKTNLFYKVFNWSNSPTGAPNVVQSNNSMLSAEEELSFV